MEKNKIYVLAGLLLTASIAFSVFLALTEKKAMVKASEPESVITEISVGEIQAVALKNASGSIGLWNLADGVLVEGEDTALYSQSKLITLIYQMAHMKAERTVEVKDEVISEFGMEGPTAIASLLLPEETIHLFLGRKSPISDEYYLKREGDSQLFMINGDLAEQMQQPVSDLKDLSMYPELTGENLKQLSQLSIINQNGKIVLQQLPSDTISNFFGMTEPVTAVLNWENVDKKVLNPLCELLPDHFVSSHVFLSEYGLDDPEYTLELVISGKKYICGFTRKSPDSWYCANLDGTLVSEINAEKIDFLNTTFMDLIGNSIYSASIADIMRLSAKYENQQIALDISGEGTTLSAAIGKKQMDSMEITEFYGKISTIPVAAILDENESIVSDPLLTISVTFRNGKEDILEFYPIADRQCAVSVNGTVEFSTYQTVVIDIMDTFDEITKE